MGARVIFACLVELADQLNIPVDSDSSCGSSSSDSNGNDVQMVGQQTNPLVDDNVQSKSKANKVIDSAGSNVEEQHESTVPEQQHPLIEKEKSEITPNQTPKCKLSAEQVQKVMSMIKDVVMMGSPVDHAV